MFYSKKKKFSNILKSCNLTLDYSLNKDSIYTLIEIFNKRYYSDFFPFYQKVNVIDIGAHKGYFSIFAAKNTHGESKIVSLEPFTKNYDCLVKNLEANNINNVIPIEAGVYSETKTMDLYISKDVNNSLFDNQSNALSNSNNSEKIKVFSLKDLFESNNFEKIDFLKIDCEGSEYPALFESDKETLSKIITISMEFHDLKDPNFNGLKMFQFLKSHSFNIEKFIYEETVMNLNYGKIIATKL